MVNIDNQSIIATNLTKVYNNNITALSNLNLTIPKGITALIGPNGAGKSTFLKLLLGLIKPSSGSLQIFGLDSWKNSSQIHECLGVVHEKHKFPDHLTVKRYLEIIDYFFRSGKLISIQSIINFPLDRQISSLSAGMHRKLCLIQCFLGTPKLVIMDEPTANLDPIARKELLNDIKKIHEEFKVDFIISSHILSDIESIASNVIVLNKGKIKFQGKYSSLIDVYFFNQFEIFVDNTSEWKEFLISFKFIDSVRDFDNKIVFTTKDKFESNSLLSLLLNSKNRPKSNINIFRKILDIEEIFN